MEDFIVGDCLRYTFSLPNSTTSCQTSLIKKYVRSLSRQSPILTAIETSHPQDLTESQVVEVGGIEPPSCSRPLQLLSYFYAVRP